jgi:hypothetical protein
VRARGVRKNRFWFVSGRLGFGLGIAALAACAGMSRYVPSAPAPSAQQAGRTDSAATTAWGRLVSDPDGTPLAGVPVDVYPWKPCRVADKRFDCPPAIVHTATEPDGKFRFTAPNGHYLLVIGSNSPANFTRPTVHDNVHLTGGVQHLLAPVLPTPSPMPNVRVWPVPRPPDQLHGLYRLTRIEPEFEAPYLRAIDEERQAHGLPWLVTDEWLTENERVLLEEYRHTGIEARIELAKTAWYRCKRRCPSAIRVTHGRRAEAKAHMDFGIFPPEINSGLMYTGAGSGPMLDATTAWEGLASELGSLTNGPPGGTEQTWP